jgi:hypothetical protein
VKDQLGSSTRALRPRARPRLDRHLVGRGGEVPGGHAGGEPGGRGTSSTGTPDRSCSARRGGPTEQAKYLKVYDMYAPLLRS